MSNNSSIRLGVTSLAIAGRFDLMREFDYIESVPTCMLAGSVDMLGFTYGNVSCQYIQQPRFVDQMSDTIGRYRNMGFETFTFGAPEFRSRYIPIRKVVESFSEISNRVHSDRSSPLILIESLMTPGIMGVADAVRVAQGVNYATGSYRCGVACDLGEFVKYDMHRDSLTSNSQYGLPIHCFHLRPFDPLTPFVREELEPQIDVLKHYLDKTGYHVNLTFETRNSKPNLELALEMASEL